MYNDVLLLGKFYIFVGHVASLAWHTNCYEKKTGKECKILPCTVRIKNIAWTAGFYINRIQCEDKIIPFPGWQDALKCSEHPNEEKHFLVISCTKEKRKVFVNRFFILCYLKGPGHEILAKMVSSRSKTRTSIGFRILKMLLSFFYFTVIVVFPAVNGKIY